LIDRDKKDLIEEWYDQFSEPIIKYIVLMTKDYQLAEDIMQETFIRAYRTIATYRNEASPKTWLFRIAHNLTVDYFRKKKPTIQEMNFFTRYKDNGLGPDDQVYIKEKSQQITKAILRLKKAYKEVIVLRKVHHFNTKETAEILNWSDSKVKSKLKQALKALEKQLEKEDGKHYAKAR
jgi:RNA polymerase sigma-70 factor, ECF subfamily